MHITLVKFSSVNYQASCLGSTQIYIKKSFYALLLVFQQIIIIIEHIQSLICMHMYLFIYFRSNVVIIAIINNTVTQYEYKYLYIFFVVCKCFI